MKNPIYAQPSKLGLGLLALLNIPIECDAITAIEFAEAEYGYKYSECQIIRYLWRLGAKDSIKIECDKILDYIDRAIANESHLTETLIIIRAEIECLLLRQI